MTEALTTIYVNVRIVGVEDLMPLNPLTTIFLHDLLQIMQSRHPTLEVKL